MGFFGTGLLAKGIEEDSENLPGDIDRVDEFTDGWGLAWSMELYAIDDERAMTAISEDSGSGCLIFVVLDSSAAVIGAYSPQTGVTRATLNRDLALEDLPDEDLGKFPEAPAAADGLVAWAAAVGLQPDRGAVETILDRQPDPFVEPLLYALLEATSNCPRTVWAGSP